MKASEQARQYGTTIAEVSRTVGKDRATITLWAKEKPLLFRLVCQGVAENKAK